VLTRNRLVADANEGNEAVAEITPEAFAELKAETERLATKNREILTEAKKAKEAVKRYEGVDPDEYKTLKQQAAEAAQRKALEEGNLESWKQQFVDQFNKEKEPILNENKSLRSAVEQYLVDAQASSALAEAKGSPKVLLPHIKAHVRVMQEEGQFVARVVDGKGNPRIGDAQGNPMTIKQLVDELKQDPDFARNFEGSGSSGGGAPRSNAGGGGGVKTIAAGDNAAFLANLDGILDGSVKIAG
jgi:hypothetical protein